MIFDTHAHYSDEQFDKDRDELLWGMEDEGVGTIVEIGASMESSREAIRLCVSGCPSGSCRGTE